MEKNLVLRNCQGLNPYNYEKKLLDLLSALKTRKERTTVGGELYIATQAMLNLLREARLSGLQYREGKKYGIPLRCFRNQLRQELITNFLKRWAC